MARNEALEAGRISHEEAWPVYGGRKADGETYLRRFAGAQGDLDRRESGCRNLVARPALVKHPRDPGVWPERGAAEKCGDHNPMELR